MQTLLTVKSITYAQKGQQFLEKNWIHSSVVPTPEMISKRGCSYALLVRGDADRAAKLLGTGGHTGVGQIFLSAWERKRPMNGRAVYFDQAATSWPKPPAVIQAVNQALIQFGGNPGHGGHGWR